MQTIQNSSASEILRTVAGLELVLPGRREPHLSFTGARVESARASMLFSLFAANDGNVILKDVRGHVTVTQGGRLVVSAPIGPGTFVSHTSIEMPIEVTHAPPRGGVAYRVRAQLFYKHHVANLNTLVPFPDRAPGQATSRSGVDRWIAAVFLGALLALLLRRSCTFVVAAICCPTGRCSECSSACSLLSTSASSR